MQVRPHEDSISVRMEVIDLLVYAIYTVMSCSGLLVITSAVT